MNTPSPETSSSIPPELGRDIDIWFAEQQTKAQQDREAQRRILTAIDLARLDTSAETLMWERLEKGQTDPEQ